tara:strand:- start:543 stop:884 length:342 start_codon:yes stop_codon:yes gene_type:complete
MNSLEPNIDPQGRMLTYNPSGQPCVLGPDGGILSITYPNQWSYFVSTIPFFHEIQMGELHEMACKYFGEEITHDAFMLALMDAPWLFPAEERQLKMERQSLRFFDALRMPETN